MKKVILLTGAAGYIGSVLTRRLLEANYAVLALDNLSFGGESLVGVWHHPHFKFIKADLNDFDHINDLLASEPVEGIVHLAAIVGDPASRKQPELTTRTNWDASVNLLDAARKNKVQKFIFASTCSNYGKMSDPDSYVDEFSELAPVSLYAELKVKYEKLLLDNVEKSDDFQPTCLRFATVYGVSPRMRFDLTVNEFTRDLALNRELEVFGEEFWRPYCHVEDIARALLATIEAEPQQVAYQAINVGDTNENYQKITLVKLLKGMLPEARISFRHKDEDPRDYRVAFDKIKNTLNFQITRTVAEGMHEIIDLIQSGVLLDPDDPKYKNV